MKIDGHDIDIQNFRDDWALALMEQGIIVKMSISRWRAKGNLSFEDFEQYHR